MELYVLDNQLRRAEVFDVFESLIWTDRYSAYGDFQLTLPSSSRNLETLSIGKFVSCDRSNRVAVIENLEDRVDQEGRQMMTVSGRSLEAFLINRANRSSLSFNAGSSPPAKITRTGYPLEIANYWFDVYVRTSLTAADRLPLLVSGNKDPIGNIPFPDFTVTMEFGYGSIYQTIKDICDIFGMGFRFERGPDDGTLYFSYYMGTNQTTKQTATTPVVFAQELDSLTASRQFRSMEEYANLLAVIGKNGTRWVFQGGASTATAGFDRRVAIVDATDIDLPSGTELQNALQRRGEDELRNHRALMAIDGEIPQNSPYIYRKHYYLGNLVELRDRYGNINEMKVAEQIIIHDSQGERAYPTLRLDQFLTPGSWAAGGLTDYWETAPGYWNQQP